MRVPTVAVSTWAPLLTCAGASTGAPWAGVPAIDSAAATNAPASRSALRAKPVGALAGSGDAIESSLSVGVQQNVLAEH